MDWLQVQIELGSLDPEPVEAALFDLGALAVEYQDGGDRPILEPAPDTTPLWPELRLGALLSPDTDPERVRLAIAGAISPAPLPAMHFATLGDRDWLRSFRARLEPRRFGAGLWLVPPDSPAPAGASAVVRLEPGLAFGSGAHETTALCLEWLDRTRCRGTVLDYGCGSGVLALAAVALGAARAFAVDIDPQALAACKDNATRNGLAERIWIGLPDDLPTHQRANALIANILSGPLIALAPKLCNRLAPGAAVALSGILNGQADAVRDAYAPWVDFGPVARRGEWILLSGRSRAKI
jgi:ribosomal protein L11 methyltransferase